MQKVKCSLIIAISIGLTLTTTACVLFPGDSAFRVTGVIVDEQGAAPRDCTLDLYYAENDKHVRSIQVNSTFTETFVISPQIKTYYMLIKCDGYKFKTSNIELGDPKHYSEPINLGRIVVTK